MEEKLHKYNKNPLVFWKSYSLLEMKQDQRSLQKQIVRITLLASLHATNYQVPNSELCIVGAVSR